MDQHTANRHLPRIGDADVEKLTATDFAEVCKPNWLTKPETASRIKQCCERAMIWCLANGLVSSNPVATVEALLPKQKKA